METMNFVTHDFHSHNVLQSFTKMYTDLELNKIIIDSFFTFLLFPKRIADGNHLGDVKVQCFTELN